MKGTSRITISLPTELLSEVEKWLSHRDENRSATMRRLIEDALRDAKEKTDIKQYIRAYQKQPQTEEEFGGSDVATEEALKDLPWEEHK